VTAKDPGANPGTGIFFALFRFFPLLLWNQDQAALLVVSDVRLPYTEVTALGPKVATAFGGPTSDGIRSASLSAYCLTPPLVR
jgi:hypothetical protein